MPTDESTPVQMSWTGDADQANLLEFAPDAMVIVDRQGHILFANTQVEVVFGHRPDDLVGEPVEVLVPHRFREGHPANRKAYHDSPRVRPMGAGLELYGLRRDGREVPVEISLSPVTTAHGELVLVAIRDVTERRQLELELAAARDAALEASRLKSEFLATMSHEIRTPLNGVIGMTSLLLDTELTDEQREFAETLRSSGEALLIVISDILDFSKIEAGRLELEVVGFEVRAVVEEAAELLAEQAHDKGLELATVIDSDIPAVVAGDPGRIRQVLINLLGNAVKFTAEGEVVVRAGLVGDGDDGRGGAQVTARFEVCDTGIGLEPTAIERLFQSFSQADASTTRRYGGTGLGLAISRRLVELMGGSIGVDSIAGAGSTFWFTVPLDAVRPTALDEGLDRAPLAGCRVLAVDDSATSRSILEELLRRWQADPSTAADAVGALAALRAAAEAGTPFDIVVLDQHMPGLGGLDVARMIRGDPELAATKLVMLTPSGRRGDASAAFRAGIEAFLTKPVRQSALYDVLVGLANGGEDVPSQARPPAASRAAVARGRVLVVEDNRVNQRVAVAMLERHGYRADVAANGLEAIDALERAPYAAVLMDCQMPELDGYAATAEIRRREPEGRHTPIIAMTASVLSGERDRCLAAGMDDYITKPVDVDDLADVLERWVGKSGIEAAAVEMLDGLEASGPPGAASDLLDAVEADSSARLALLDEAAGRRDLAALAEVAHRLRGGTVAMASRAVAECSGELEHAAAEGRGEDAAQLCTALATDVGRALAALRRRYPRPT